jgi:hypothetical protein
MHLYFFGRFLAAVFQVILKVVKEYSWRGKQMLINRFLAKHLVLCHNSIFPSKGNTFYELQRKILEKNGTLEGYERRVFETCCSNCMDHGEFLNIELCLECHGTGLEILWDGGYYHRWVWCGFTFRIEARSPLGELIYPSTISSNIGRISDLSFLILVIRYNPIYLWERLTYWISVQKTKLKIKINQRTKDDGIPF